ncbi:DUF2169 domain-containing protein [Azoarcus sp. TTM-91]|uniref:DUF2169 family type VI secretion system accessory protein n=1 Tax=Azoarcus sp. TTM-91 TaxID=2691581 RepID=UPI00145CF2F0|nr:DUF2169 domain-containing protein [Azoarcus sp. TTM-91]NMG36500.1 DUF2169 domain-containing protein [Azoarcus sp. TTM-91]
MLQVVNPTPLPAVLSVFAAPDGTESAFLAVKASFDLSSGVPRLAKRQANFLATDVYWGDPGQTSLRAAADITLCKPATDILLLGRAVSPTGPVRSMDVDIQVGPLQRRLRVFGNRHWMRTEQGWAISSPEGFERMPLRWELAFGGRAPAGADAATEYDRRNPVGRGFVSSSEDDIAGRPLPNIEDPAALIAVPADRPLPACCAPVAPGWMPRLTWAGTYDDAWQAQRAPYLPLDFDPRFFNVAPPGLVTAEHLVGGEAVSIVGCSAGAPLQFTLPQLVIELQWDFDGRRIPAQARLDTVLIEPDQSRLQMVWRSQLAVDKKLTRLRQVTVSARLDKEQADDPDR